MMKNSIFTLSVLVLTALSACGEMPTEETSSAPDIAFQQSFDMPGVLFLDAQGNTAGEFGYNADKGWHWIEHTNSVMPSTFQSTYLLDISGIASAAPPVSPGASGFSASTFGGVAFSASTTNQGFTPSTPAVATFAPNLATEQFDPSLSQGNGASCSLTRLCDLAVAACNYGNQDCGDVNSCYAEIYRVQFPAKLQPYLCPLVDLLECAWKSGGAASCSAELEAFGTAYNANPF